MLNPQRAFVDPLTDWYKENGRHDLPWREAGRSAFEILVAEILLQRTTADAVSGAYVPFVARYPSPEAVAAVSSDSIEERIEPLGLVKRAEFVQRCSQQLLARHAGRVPREYPDLVELHGVGEYTARSVLIHAFDREVTAEDTNVRRLISRFFDIDPDSGAINSVGDALAPPNRSSDFQHAMLDFAADVCLARSPECDTCPLSRDCSASDLGANE